ncbi:hypothetical protein LTR10_018465 [Elasticomyces elasticus]|nr:hypothetical protein LTR10_018465 [Elasticomyces elasticus]
MSEPSLAAPENRSTLKDFVASISAIRGDLSNITAPPFVLDTKSTVELPERALLVLRWFLSALRNQQYSGRAPGQGVKKPLNAFLGELFIARWEDEAGLTRLVCEQVSHHPPVTACRLWNEEHGVSAEGYTRQEITFSGNLNIQQIGHAIVHLSRHNESYLIPLPDVKVKSIITGHPYPELEGTYHIPSTNGYMSTIVFGSKGLFSSSDKKHSFEAKVYREGEEGSPLYTVKGNWDGVFVTHDARRDTEIERFDVDTANTTPLVTDSLEEQDPWESRRAWNDVRQALERGDMQGAADAKSKLENGQRELHKNDPHGKSWERLFYTTEPHDEVAERLAKKIGHNLTPADTVAAWRFRLRDWQDGKFRKPYHGDIGPDNARSQSSNSGTSQQHQRPSSGQQSTTRSTAEAAAPAAVGGAAAGISAGTGYGTSSNTGYGTGYGASSDTGYGTSSGTGYDTSSGTGYGTSSGTGYGNNSGDGYGTSSRTSYVIGSGTGSGTGAGTNSGTGYDTSSRTAPAPSSSTQSGPGISMYSMVTASGSDTIDEPSTGSWQTKPEPTTYENSRAQEPAYTETSGEQGAFFADAPIAHVPIVDDTVRKHEILANTSEQQGPAHADIFRGQEGLHTSTHQQQHTDLTNTSSTADRSAGSTTAPDETSNSGIAGTFNKILGAVGLGGVVAGSGASASETLATDTSGRQEPLWSGAAYEQATLSTDTSGRQEPISNDTSRRQEPVSSDTPQQHDYSLSEYISQTKESRRQPPGAFERQESFSAGPSQGHEPTSTGTSQRQEAGWTDPSQRQEPVYKDFYGQESGVANPSQPQQSSSAPHPQQSSSAGIVKDPTGVPGNRDLIDEGNSGKQDPSLDNINSGVRDLSVKEKSQVEDFLRKKYSSSGR